MLVCARMWCECMFIRVTCSFAFKYWSLSTLKMASQTSGIIYASVDTGIQNKYKMLEQVPPAQTIIAVQQTSIREREREVQD